MLQLWGTGFSRFVKDNHDIFCNSIALSTLRIRFHRDCYISSKATAQVMRNYSVAVNVGLDREGTK